MLRRRWNDRGLTQVIAQAAAKAVPLPGTILRVPPQPFDIRRALAEIDPDAEIPDAAQPQVGRPSSGRGGVAAETFLDYTWAAPMAETVSGKWIRYATPEGISAFAEKAWDWSSKGYFLLALTASSPEADEAFLRALFSPDSPLRQDFMPPTGTITTSVELELLTDLYWTSGFKPSEAADTGDDDDEEEDEDGPLAGKRYEQRKVPEWGSDLYVIPPWPSDEEIAAKLAELAEETQGSRYPGWAGESRLRRWLEQYEPYLPPERAEESRRREIREWLVANAAFV